MIHWQEPHGGAACSPSSPSLHEKSHEVMCYLKSCIKLRTTFDANILRNKNTAVSAYFHCVIKKATEHHTHQTAGPVRPG